MRDRGNVNIEKSKIVLYLVIDRKVHGLINYFRECGVNLSNIYDSIIEARNRVLVQSKPSRVIFADTGTGRFSRTNIRKDIIDMLGICDENTKITVFYTDSMLKADAMREIGRTNIKIDWVKYTSTADMVARILTYGEDYELDESSDPEDEIPEPDFLFKINGIRTDEDIVEDQFRYDLNIEELVKNLLDSSKEPLKGYKVDIYL